MMARTGPIANGAAETQDILRTRGEGVYAPTLVREVLRPLRRVAADTDVAVVGLLHPTKAGGSFRQVVAGSHQFNAVSRSSLLLAVAPDDEKRRVLVRGKGNHTA